MADKAPHKIRLALQSSRRLMRDALAAYLAGRPDFTLVGQAAGIADLHPLCLLRRPDATIVDAGPLTTDLVAQLQELRTAFPAIHMVVTYSEPHPAAIRAATRAGLTGMVPSSRGLDAVLGMLCHQQNHPVAGTTPGNVTLTPREREIVSLLAAGHRVPEISRLLHIRPRTVENHKRHLYAKLDVGTQCHAVSRATSLGLTRPVPLTLPTSGTCHRPAITDGRDPLVAVAGPPGPGLDEVTQSLVNRGVTVIHVVRCPPADHTAHPPGDDTTRPDSPLATILVDPRPGDWLLPAALAAPAVVVHTAEPTVAAIADALLHGARAMLRREQVRTDLASVLSLVHRGYITMDADRFAELSGWVSTGTAPHPSGLPDLTVRERDILTSIADGHTVRQTARALGIAAKTVENTQARLFRKLGARNRSGALTVAYRLGLIDPAAGGDLTP
jgi:DNA-binding NarL/FixJ family response regulator